MTAIRCAIIIGANQAAAKTASAHHLADRIAGNPQLAMEVRERLDQFSADMDDLFARYLAWNPGGAPGDLPPGEIAAATVSER